MMKIRMQSIYYKLHGMRRIILRQTKGFIVNIMIQMISKCLIFQALMLIFRMIYVDERNFLTEIH